MNKPLSEIREELRALLVDDLAESLKYLLQQLPAGSEKHRSVLTLSGKLNDTNKARLRGTISNENLQLAYNQIRSDLLDLIDGLREADFDAEAPGAEVDRTARQGEILYRIPDAMPLGRETRCLVRIALHADALVENIMLDDQVTLKPLARVSDLMQVELLDPAETPAFRIRTISSPEQLVEDAGYTEWLFWVSPLREGTFPLMIKVSVIELLMGRERKKEIVLEEEVRISADASPSEGPLKHSGESLVFRPGEQTDTRTPRSIEAQAPPPPPAGAAPAPAKPQKAPWPPIQTVFDAQESSPPARKQARPVWLAVLILVALLALIAYFVLR